MDTYQDIQNSVPAAVIPRSISLLSKKYLIESGKVTRVTNFMGLIRFKRDNDENGLVDECLFFLNSYILKRIRTLCQVFSVGDWVGFVAAKFEGGHWTALDVRPRSGIMQGYGQLRKTSNAAMTSCDAIITPQFKTPFGGADIEFCIRAFKTNGQKRFEKLVDGDWLRFLALVKPEEAVKGACSAVAVEVEIPVFLGLIVKRIGGNIQIWSAQIGLTTAEVENELFTSTVGDWVRFRLTAVNEKNELWTAVDVTTAAPPPDTSVKIGRYLRVTTIATAGVLSDRFGTVWSENLGRMTIWRWCLKDVGVKPFQRMIVRAFYNSNDERRFDTQGDAWTVYQLKAAPTSTKIHRHFAPPPSSIIHNVIATVERTCMTPRKWYATSTLPPCYWRLHNERFGTIIAKPVDVQPVDIGEGIIISLRLKPGDRVKVAILPASLNDVGEYRAFVIEMLCPKLIL